MGNAHDLADAVRELRDGVTGAVYLLDDFQYEGRPRRWVTVGRDLGCDIVLSTAEAFHCMLLREDGRLFVRDDQYNGRTLVNGIPVLGGLVELAVGGLLMAGTTTLLACGELGEEQDVRIDPVAQKQRILDMWRPAEGSADQARPGKGTRTATADKAREGDAVYYLRPVGDDSLIRLHQFVDILRPERPVVLGSNEACVIRVEDDSVSEEHCALRLRDRRWYVQDRGSKNGSFVDGVRLPQHAPVELSAGSVLALGEREFLACGSQGLRQVARTAPRFREYGRRAVRFHRTKSQAARLLGVPRQTLQGWLKRMRGEGAP